MPGRDPKTALQVAEKLMSMVTNGPVNNSLWASHTTPQFCSKPPLGLYLFLWFVLFLSFHHSTHFPSPMLAKFTPHLSTQIT